jgi:hypothetical protein
MNYLGKHEEERPVYEKSLNAAETYIESQKDPVVTVKKVWEDVARRAKLEHFEIASLPDFTALLDADKRFQIIPARNEDDIADTGIADGIPDVDFEEEEMEQLGFFSEDRVRLKSAPVMRSAEDEIPEEEEDVASIRHRSFITQAEKKIVAKKKIKTARVKKAAPKTVRAKKIKILRKKKNAVRNSPKKKK